MSRPTESRSPTPGPVARFLLSLVLLAHPAPYKVVFCERIAETFWDRYADKRQCGRAVLFRFLVRFVLDGIAAGIAERRSPTLPRPGHPPTGITTRDFIMNRVLDAMVLDLRFALRSIRRRPGFSGIAATTLALGIGGNTAIFSVINGVLLQPLPYNDPSELVAVNVARNAPGERPGSMSYPDLSDLRERVGSFESLVGINTISQTLTGLGDPAVMSVTRVTEGLLRTFHVAPHLGRDIRAEEFGPTGPAVVVISHESWNQRFGAAPDVLGTTVTLNGFPYEIVGVAPQEFDYPNGTHFWVPRRLDPARCGRGCHTMFVVGRLAPGTSLESAVVEVDALAANLTASFPATNTGKRFLVRRLKDTVVGDVEQGLWIMLAAVGLVLLIACSNVVNLLLARASAREGEFAVRAALGASGRRLAGQVLVESGVLALVGGVAGLGLAVGGVEVLRRAATGTIPRTDLIEIDGIVMAVTAGTVVLVTLVFGLIPAFTASRTSVVEGLLEAGRGKAGSQGSVHIRRALLAGEVALSAALLIGAGLLLRTFAQLHAVDVGFETREVIRFNVVLPANDYPDIKQASSFYGSLENAIAALPGVEGVGTMFGPPLGRARASGEALVEGRPQPPPEEEKTAWVRSITPGLLTALRIPIVEGRPLSVADNRSDAEPVALVNQEFVRQHFPAADPIGRRIRVGVNLGFGSPYWRVVGVVGNVRFEAITSEPRADVYMPHAQYGPRSMTVHVRTHPDAPPVLPEIRRAVRTLDPNVPIYQIEVIEQVISREIAPTRLFLLLVAGFAATAVLLAAVGLYGVVNYIVTQRTREIGIRIALGARPEAITRLVVHQGLQPAALGLAVGLLGAFLGGHVMEAVLFGVHPRNPAIYVSVAALMTTIALAAAAIPAVRASRTDPAEVLRAE